MGIILCTFSSGKLKKVGGDFHFFYGCCSSSYLSCNIELREKVGGAEGGRGKVSTDSVSLSRLMSLEILLEFTKISERSQ